MSIIEYISSYPYSAISLGASLFFTLLLIISIVLDGFSPTLPLNSFSVELNRHKNNASITLGILAVIFAILASVFVYIG